MAKILWWDFARVCVQAFLWSFYRLRVVGRENVPRQGPILTISNHQSFLDPPINGVALADRQCAPIARESLFRFKPFAWLIRSFGALPISGAGGEAAALKVALRELAEGRTVLIYPEGTRSLDGAVQPFERGVLLLQRRSKADVLPMAIEGANDVWPPTRSFPRLRGRIEVRVGQVIPAAQLAECSSDEAIALLERRVESLRLEARAAIRARTRGRWPRAEVEAKCEAGQ
jgi:1-acyl-sn-glycerol-3-phosphate acyltransferase